MNIKSILLGSAAALAVVSGAQAADAIVAAAPEPAEYVKVCDAFGAGYFYIPGTETCLKIGGFVRFQVGGNSNTTVKTVQTTPVGTAVNGRKWNAATTASLTASAKTDSDLGLVDAFIDMRSGNDNGAADGTNNVFRIDSAYLALGGLKAGYFAGYFDKGIGEGSSWASAAKFNTISYTYNAEGLSLGLALDEIREASMSNAVAKPYTYAVGTTAAVPGILKDRNNNGLGVEILAAYTVGGLSANFIGVYDGDTQNGAIKGILSAKDVGPGTLSLAGYWSNGENVYTGLNTYDATTPGTMAKITALGNKWAIGAAYNVAATDKLSIMPEFQITQSLENEQGKSAKSWMVGALTSYSLTSNLAASLDVNYFSTEDMTGKKDHYTSGYVRLQRSF